MGEMQEQQAQREMPRYRCHKEVWALKIAKIDATVNGFTLEAIITPVEEGYAPFAVPHAYIVKHEPRAGGYFVVYPPDGYQSYSPAAAFESGYTRI